MKDWTLIARAHGLNPEEPQVRQQIATMTQLESILANLKKKLADDAEPAPIFRPLVTNREKAN